MKNCSNCLKSYEKLFLIIISVTLSYWALDRSDRASDRFHRALNMARGIKLEIGLRINNTRHTVLACLSSFDKFCFKKINKNIFFFDFAQHISLLKEIRYMAVQVIYSWERAVMKWTYKELCQNQVFLADRQTNKWINQKTKKKTKKTCNWWEEMFLNRSLSKRSWLFKIMDIIVAERSFFQINEVLKWSTLRHFIPLIFIVDKPTF